MSGKLDQSLDEITSAQRRGNRNARGGRGNARSAPRRGPAAPTAPVGGIKKSVKARGGAKVPTGPSSTKGDSKIIISNLPKDVNEAQIKEYLMQTVGPVKRAEIAYGPNGESRGAATVIFVHLDSATKAAKVLKDVLLDKRPLKIDIIVDAKQAANLPAPKGLSDRITAPKAQPKSAAAKPKADAAGRGGRGRGGRNGRGGRGGRTNAPKKTNEELDSEMADYWTAGAAAETNGTAAPAAATTDAPMEDEIL